MGLRRQRDSTAELNSSTVYSSDICSEAVTPEDAYPDVPYEIKLLAGMAMKNDQIALPPNVTPEVGSERLPSLDMEAYLAHLATLQEEASALQDAVVSVE